MASIAEILLEQGRQQAETRRRQGEISGQMWTNLANIIGQTGQSFAAKQDPRYKLEQAQATEAQQTLKGQQALSGLQQAQGATPQGPAGPEGGTLAPLDFTTQQGGATIWDPAKVEHYLSQVPGIDLAQVMTHVHAMNDAHLEEASRGQAFQQAQTNSIARTAGGVRALVQNLVKAGAPLDQAVASSVDSVRPLLIANGKPADQVDQILTGLKQHPEQADAWLQHLESLSSEKPTIVPEGATPITNAGNPLMAPNPKPPTEAELATKAAAGDANAAAAMKLLKPGPQTPNRTAEQDDDRYRNIKVALMMNQPVTPQDEAWAKAYEGQKTLGVDTTASAAADRQASAIAAQTAQQKRGQDFTELQAGREALNKDATQPFLTAQTSANTMRDVVSAAQGGNKVAASMQSLEATMSAIRAQGLNRINTTELGVAAGAGNAWDRIVGWFGKADAGQPVPANIQKDMLAFADLLEQQAAVKYKKSFDATVGLYPALKDKVQPIVTPKAAATAHPPMQKYGATYTWDGQKYVRQP